MTVFIDKIGNKPNLPNAVSRDAPNPRKGAERHPEKRWNEDRPSGRKPAWIRVKAPTGTGYAETAAIVRKERLFTVCEEAGCPNIGECWEKKHATFMILGSVCTRACAFCNVATGRPEALDLNEPERVGRAVAAMGLHHCVITSVDRDDLPDGGAEQFVAVIREIRKQSPATSVEILTPDFKGKPHAAVESVIDAKPDVFNHNLETVPRLYPSIRPGARYFTSLRLLASVKERDPTMFTKSGIMVGLGESLSEVVQVMDDLRAADVDFITIGQYLQPTPKHAKVEEFVHPDTFAQMAAIAEGKGFLMVSSSPLTRSSHHAGDDFAKLKGKRLALSLEKS